jgi:hypothetical protein
MIQMTQQERAAVRRSADELTWQINYAQAVADEGRCDSDVSSIDAWVQHRKAVRTRLLDLL